MPTKAEKDQIAADEAAQEAAEKAVEREAARLDEMTDEERAEYRRQQRLSPSGPKMRYEGLAPGDYAGNMGGQERTLHVKQDGVVETKEIAVQAYIEGVLGREGTLVE